MTAEIIPFPHKGSEPCDQVGYTVDLMHLDLTAQCLRDRGWAANIGTVDATGFEKVPMLRTDAALPDVISASEEAHEILYHFMVSECDLDQSDVPNQEYFAQRVAAALTK